MKNNLFQLLVNPFTRIAGWQAFGLGLLFLALMGFVGSSSGVAFDGVFDMHLFENSVLQAFTFLGIDVLSLVLVMWVVGLFTSKNFRFIDILGTMVLAKAPFLILAVYGYFVTAPDLNAIMKDPNVILQSTSFLIMMILTMPIMAWGIALIFNALKVSCDLKGSRLTIAFIIGLFVSEIIAKILIHFLV